MKINLPYSKLYNNMRELSATPKHGSPSTYVNHKCRCAECKKAWAEYFKLGQGSKTSKKYRQSENGKAKHRRAKRKRSRGIDITDEECILLLQAQGNKCAICEITLEYPGNRATSLDHDHATGRVRGILCLCCNLGLGSFKDSPEILDKAISYLKAFAGG